MPQMETKGLLGYQIPVATHLCGLLRAGQNAVDASDCGTGKTFSATAIARELDLPTLVVCPAISITSWKRAGAALGTTFDVLNIEMIRTGNTPYGSWENPRPKNREKSHLCTVCQLKVEQPKPIRCPHHHLGIHCIVEKTKPHDYGKFAWHGGIGFLIFDEIHMCGAQDSLNSQLLIAARRQNIRVLGLSATVADTPLNFKALGYVLGLHGLVDRSGGEIPGFWRWAGRMGCRKSPFGGLAFQGNEQHRRIKMGELHAEIFPARGARIRIAELGDAFPTCQVTAELYDLKESGRIDELYAEMDDAIQELNERKLLDKNLEHPLTRILRAKQQIELLKVPLFEELTRAAIEQGKTVGLFVNYSQTIEELCKRLKTDCKIDGSQIGAAGHRRRQENIDRVQADEERIIVLNNQAGGVSVSLQDLTGKHPRFGAVSLPNSARNFKQLLGRFPRSGGKSPSLYRVILAAGTVEEKLHQQLQQKLNQLDALNDADLWAANLPLKKHALNDLTQDESDAILSQEK